MELGESALEKGSGSSQASLEMVTEAGRRKGPGYEGFLP